MPAVSKRSLTARRRPAGPSPSFVMKISVLSGVGPTEPTGSIQPEGDEPDADRAREEDHEQAEERPAPREVAARELGLGVVGRLDEPLRRCRLGKRLRPPTATAPGPRHRRERGGGE